MNLTGPLAAPSRIPPRHLVSTAEVQSSITSLAELLEMEGLRARWAFVQIRQSPQDASWQAELAQAMALLHKARGLLYGSAPEVPVRGHCRDAADAGEEFPPLLAASRRTIQQTRALLAEAAVRLDRFSAAIRR